MDFRGVMAIVFEITLFLTHPVDTNYCNMRKRPHIHYLSHSPEGHDRQEQKEASWLPVLVSAATAAVLVAGGD